MEEVAAERDLLGVGDLQQESEPISPQTCNLGQSVAMNKQDGTDGRPVSNTDGTSNRWDSTNVEVGVGLGPSSDTIVSLTSVEMKGECEDNTNLPSSPFMNVHLLQPLYEGSFGKVYDAAWFGGKVAVSVIEAKHGTTQGKLNDGLDAVLPSLLSHPNIVQTFMCNARTSSRLDTSEVWLVHELCDRGALSQYCNVAFNQSDSILRVIGVSLDVACAGAYLHSSDIIHGDLTADNVLLKTDSLNSKGYVCKICDVRLCRILTTEESHSQDIDIVRNQYGTATHMAPELFQNLFVTLTQKADVYASGVILWQVLMGKKPFDGLSGAEIAIQMRKGCSLVLPDYTPQDIQIVFDSCTALSPQMRPKFDELVSTFVKCARLRTIFSERSQRMEANTATMVADVFNDAGGVFVSD